MKRLTKGVGSNAFTWLALNLLIILFFVFENGCVFVIGLSSIWPDMTGLRTALDSCLAII